MSSGVRRSQLLHTRVVRFTRPLGHFERGDVRALHRTRVGTRRLRELVPVLQLDGETGTKLSRRLRKVTTRLGTVRELDVLLLLIDELHAARPAFARALQRANVEVAKRRDAARKALFKDQPVSDLRRLAAKLDRLVDDLRADEDSPPRAAGTARAVRWAIDARLVHRAARLQTALGAAGALYVPEPLHDVRIAVKKLRYAVELSAEVSGGRQDAPLRALRRTQDLLGRMHDFQVLIACVREIQTSVSPSQTALWRELDALVAALEDDCRRLHGRYVGERPALAAIAGKLAARPTAPAQAPAPRVDHARLRRRAG
jgi:CHAD domain-containing protein